MVEPWCYGTASILGTAGQRAFDVLSVTTRTEDLVAQTPPVLIQAGPAGQRRTNQRPSSMDAAEKGPGARPLQKERGGAYTPTSFESGGQV